VAVVDGGVALTYGELNARADRLARRLRSLGVGPVAPAAMLLARSAEAIVAMLGTLKAGGAYGPLDPGYPGRRLALMLADSGAVAVLTRAELVGRIPPGYAGAVLRLEDEPLDQGPEPAAPAEVVTPDGLAYVIYTSGSTGTPKGVAVPHRAVV